MSARWYELSSHATDLPVLLPAASHIARTAAAERIAGKDDVEQLLRSLEAEEGMADALHIARSLPPSVYGEESWAIVAALLAVLPQAAAELALVFAAHSADRAASARRCDHISRPL